MVPYHVSVNVVFFGGADFDPPLDIRRPRDVATIGASIEGSTRVESFQIDPNKAIVPADSSHGVGGYKIVARGPTLTALQADEFKDLVLDPSIRPAETAREILNSLCYISPHHAFRMSGGPGPPVDVLGCLSCAHVDVVQKDSPVCGGNASSISDDLRAIVQDLFPGDKWAR